MRKLLIGGVLLIGAMIAWVSYLDHQTKRFVEELPEAPPEHHLDTAPVVDTPASVPSESEERGSETSETPTNLAPPPAEPPAPAPALEEVSIQEEVPEPDDTGLSPEMEALFIGVRLFREEIFEVIAVLDPMIVESIAATHRQQEISRELNGDPDPETEQALYAERAELLAREEELSPRIFELQDRRRGIEAERDALLKEHGVADWQTFKETHGDAYKTWRSTAD